LRLPFCGALLSITFLQMSAFPSDSISLLAKAVLCLGTGMPIPPSILDGLRALAPAAVPVADAPVADAPVADAPAPVKEKKVRKTAKAAAAAGAASAEPPAVVAADAAPAATGGDPWRAHPSRLQSIDSNRCFGRRIDVTKALVGTRKGDTGANNGMIFPERQCSSKPAPGSKLCASCATKDATYKADPTVNDSSWQGRLDENVIYPRAKIVGSEHFLKKYPNGIHDDIFRPNGAAATGTAAAAVVVAPATTATAAKRAPKKAAAAAAAASVATTDTVAADVAPVMAKWRSFLYEGRAHIRNLETNKVYYADIAKATPEMNAVADQYVGRWVDDPLAPNGSRVEICGDSDDEE
jgi:hypothetical protein